MKRFKIFLLCVSLCLGGSITAIAAEPVKTLLLLGQKPDGHPAGTHEYLLGQKKLAELLKDVPGLRVEVVEANDPWSDGPERLAKADGVVLFVSQGANWVQADPRRYEAFAKLAQRGGGLSVFHWGCGSKSADDVPGFVRLFGACHGGPDRKYTFFEEIGVDFPESSHRITAGMKPFRVGEEFYFQLKRADAAAGKLTPIVTIRADDRDEMVGWAFERTDGGRSFGFSGLHFHKNWERPEYRSLLSRGVLWTVGL